MTRAIILIRHAQPVHHVQGLTSGWTDTSLTDLGCRQAACLASRLRRELSTTPCQLYSSDLRRALETAQIIGRELSLAPQPVPELRDINNGIAAGKTEAEAERYLLPRTEPLLDWCPYPQAETWRQFYARVVIGMERLTENQDALRVIVTHGGTIINAIAWWLGLDIEMLRRVSFDALPASISVLRTNQWGERTLERLNDSAHLYAAGLGEGMQLDL
jgi:probable phosphoglycerate mutase